jgi:ubiquinone/menaquinone biosynthesis C-methylase UbiE
MPDYFEIYSKQADQYELLVSREDYQHNIFRTLNQLVSIDGLTVVEFGAGTGRLTCMFAPLVKSIFAFDRSQHMLDVAKAKLHTNHVNNWQIAVSDHRHVPLRKGFADVAISGWSICYMVVGNNETWQTELSKALCEMNHVIHPGGILILLETLGTGCEQPDPPADLLSYYEFLGKQGYQRTWIRTDYQFRDMLEAKTLTRFFFGDEMVDKIILDGQGVILPECTGIWWLKPEMLP